MASMRHEQSAMEGASFQFQCQSSSEPSDNALRVVLLGKTGAGKSSLGNTLLQRDEFKVECSFSSVTFKCQWAQCHRDGINLQVTDTPGVSDTGRDQDEVLLEVGKSIAVASPGPHVILMVLRCDRRFTKEEHQAYVTLKQLFGEDITKFLIVVFAGADGLEGHTHEEQHECLRQALSSAPEDLKEVVADAGGRYFAISNTAHDKQQQAGKLCHMMKELVARNNNAYFTNPLCQRVNTDVETLVERRVQTHHMTHDEAADATRLAIVRDEEDPGFLRRLGQAVGEVLIPIASGFVGQVVGGVAKAAVPAILSRCSVM